ncbi:hypothetical protein EW146_g8011 [Bondarzewia mesenterica]|uniref:Flavin reductase like domain-containing protein n=1 Tax=Bondarzewia mesenterica TaxID=1095465 RepID=A0A4S4LHX6_9AGAM|nr:hypothetical protein EW146_g8011 [Bondarzewia mesenterica]
MPEQHHEGLGIMRTADPFDTFEGCCHPGDSYQFGRRDGMMSAASPIGLIVDESMGLGSRACSGAENRYVASAKLPQPEAFHGPKFLYLEPEDPSHEHHLKRSLNFLSSMSSHELPHFDEQATFKHTAPPNSAWTYGQRVDATVEGKEWLSGERDGWKVVDAGSENPMKLYALMISGIVPRPIAFVSTVSATGIENLAPFSWFNQVSANPPVISISCTNGPTRIKDTANNIKATKGFTVSIISEAFVENSNVCSIDAPEEVSEWPASGLTKKSSIHVKPACVKESAFSMECELFKAIDVVHPTTGQTATTLILGLVKYVHVRKDVFTENGTVDPARLKPVSRLGDTTYSRLGDGFRLARPSWSQEGEKLQEATK